MAYTKQVWRNFPDRSTPVSAERLTHMEDGIAAAGGGQLNPDGTLTDAARAFITAALAPIIQPAIDAQAGWVSTRSFPAVMLLSGKLPKDSAFGVGTPPTEDATAALNVMFNKYPYVRIDGWFNWGATADLDWQGAYLRGVELAPDAILQQTGAFTVRRRGKWAMNEQLGGTRQMLAKTNEFTGMNLRADTTASGYNVDDWIMIASNDRQTNLSGFTYYGSIRKVTTLGPDGRVVVDKEVNRSFTLGRHVSGIVRTNRSDNIVTVYDASVFTVGQKVDIYSSRTQQKLRNDAVITAVQLSPAQIVIDGAAIETVEGDYIGFYAENNGVIGGPWTMKLTLAKPFFLHLDKGSQILGQGYRSPSLDGTTIPGSVPAKQYGTSAPLMVFELCHDLRIYGQGTIGSNPQTALQWNNNVGGSIDGITIRDVYDTGTDDDADGGAGYLISINGASRDFHFTPARLLRGRHGVTTNVGGNIYLDPTSSTPVYRQAIDDGQSNYGGIGEPEGGIIAPYEVAYCTAHGLDSHRNGWGLIYIINNVHDNAGGVNIRADATILYGVNRITGAHDRSAVAVSVEVDVAATLIGVKVHGLRGSRTDASLIKLSAPFVLIDCEVEYDVMTPRSTGMFFDTKATGTVYRSKFTNVGEALRFNGTGVRIVDPRIDYATVPSTWSATSAAGDNQIITSSDPQPGTHLTDNVINYFTTDSTGTVTPTTFAANTQYIAPVTLPSGWVKTMYFTVATAGAAGATVQMALFASDPAGRPTDKILVEGTVAVSATGKVGVVFATPVKVMGSGKYYIGMRVDGAFTPNQLNAIGSRFYQSADDALASVGQGYVRSNTAGSWAAWNGSASLNTRQPRVAVGISSRL